MKISHWLKTADVTPDVKRISIEYIPKTQTTIVTFVTTTGNQFALEMLFVEWENLDSDVRSLVRAHDGC